MLVRWLPLCAAFAACAAVAAGGRPVDTAGSVTLTLAASVTSGTAPTALTLTATVAGTSLSGSIVFKDGAAILGTATLSKSKATLAVTLDAGIHRLTAVYPGPGSELVSAVVNVIVDNALACR